MFVLVKVCFVSTADRDEKQLPLNSVHDQVSSYRKPFLSSTLISHCMAWYHMI